MIAALACMNLAMTACAGASAPSVTGATSEESGIEIIFLRDGANVDRDAVAARCGFHPVERATDQPRGRMYDGDRKITENMLTCLSHQPEIERVALAG